VVSQLNQRSLLVSRGTAHMRNPVDLQIGQRVRHRRWLLGMTQQQLADAVGIRFQQIQKYECGANRISASRLWVLAQALKADVSAFFDGLDLASISAQGESMLQRRETLDLVRAYYAMDEGPRRRLLALTEALSSCKRQAEKETALAAPAD
jgi:transcriptional regulator with XRE-family HTH domain